jgi:hypothetical protein
MTTLNANGKIHSPYVWIPASAGMTTKSKSGFFAPLRKTIYKKIPKSKWIPDRNIRE